MNVRIKLMVGAGSLALAFMVGCGADTTNTTSNANVTNVNATTNLETTSNTEYETARTEAGGVTTETRTYRNNKRISRVVITTRDGKRTARVYSVSGQEKEIRADDLDNVLAKTGDAIADAAGFVADKAEDVGGKAKDIGMEAADKTEDAVGAAGRGAKAVGEKTVEGAKTVGRKTAQGAKKVGGAIKDAVTP